MLYILYISKILYAWIYGNPAETGNIVPILVPELVAGDFSFSFPSPREIFLRPQSSDLDSPHKDHKLWEELSSLTLLNKCYK